MKRMKYIFFIVLILLVVLTQYDNLIKLILEL